VTGFARRGGLDPGCGCGLKRYQGHEAAEIARDKAVRLALPGTEPERLRLKECKRRPGVWHLVEAGHRETFPPEVAALITARDPWCVLCGSPRGLHLHHRRIKGAGGDPRPCTDCTCNGVRICWRDHARIHDTDEGRVLAEAEGLIIPRATVAPGSVSVLVHLAGDAGGLQKWPSCDGDWLDFAPGGLAA
jgi:hypothetical protein